MFLFRTTCCVFFALFLSASAYAQAVPEQLKYLGQEPPTTPQVFAPGLISLNDAYEFGSVFNRAGTEFYYGVDTGGSSEIRYSALKDGRWTKPVTILSAEAYGFNDPFLSPDEQRLYFISVKALNGPGAKEDYDIWYVKKEGDGWSEPVNAGPNINSGRNEYYISFTDSGTMYFSSNSGRDQPGERSFDIYASASVDGVFQKPERLGPAVNTAHYEADVFVAPDESYLIFCATRPDGLGRGDLYISFRGDDGYWLPSVSMGAAINTEGHELCPFVSADGKYFFYTSNKDIHWVSTAVIESLRRELGE